METTAQHSILVIDDNSDMLELQKTILEMNGYEVFTAQSGGEALKILGEIKEPDLILLDMRMEDMSGTDFLLMLEEKKPEIIKDVPVVFHTALDEVPASKAAGFIRKARDIGKYVEDVRRFIKLGKSGQSVH